MNVYNIMLPENIYSEKKEIKRYEINEAFRVFNIQDKNEDNISIDRDWHVQHYSFPLSQSEIDLFLRHREAWKAFLYSDEDVCLIVESHISLDFNFEDVLQSLKDLSIDWDVFFPYDKYLIIEEQNKKNNKLTLNSNIWEKQDLEPYLLGFNWGSSIYFLSRSGAAKLITIDIIKQPVDEEMIYRTSDGSLNIHYQETGWFNLSDYHEKRFLDRQRTIRDAVLNYNLWSPEAEISLEEILKKISIASEEIRKPLVLHGGTHLGYIRHGTKMPWDDDIDLGIEEDSIPAFVEEIRKQGLIISLMIESVTNAPYYKIWSEKGQLINGHKHRFPFVDIWMYIIKGNDIVFKNGIIWPNSGRKPLKMVDFEGGKFAVPFNSMECLDSSYKDWKTKIRIYIWSHQQETWGNFPLITDIKVDEKGKMIDIE